jgi:GT2 family glycosyltransferase
MRAERDAALSEADAAVREAASLYGEIVYLRRTAGEARRELARPSWQVFQWLRNRLFEAIGQESPLARVLRVGLVVVVNVVKRRRWSYGLSKRIVMPRSGEPVASLIIPVHAQPALTESCLGSIVRSTGVPCEVILVDDTADRETKRLLRSVRNARLIVNETNLGFTRSVNRAAVRARGRYLVVCNNDIAVQSGWLEALVGCAESASDIGVVTPRFLYPDGTLNEAGGIVWRDATAANFGRGENPGLPIYNYRREVDYGSAAALLVRRDLWTAIGGFDERYAPSYYEDTDLCFAARELGFRVMYEPAATVVHVEGATQGTDTGSGGKRYQELNRSKFAARWAQQLEDHAPPPRSFDDIRRARDRARGPHVLVIDHRIPTPDRDSGSVRMMHILGALRGLGCSVTFLPEHLSRWEPYCRRLQEMGIQVLYDPVDVRAELAELGPRLRLAFLSRPMTSAGFVYWIRELAPQARLVYDTVDLHFLREQRRLDLEGERREALPAQAVKQIELALVRACDVTLCLSEAERQLVLEEVPDASVEVLGNAHELATDVPPAERRSGLLFVGGFEHAPNGDTAIHLVESIMPLVWNRVPDVGLEIVGSSMSDEIRALESDRVTVSGWIEEIEPVLDRARAMVAPVRYGAGVKGKITQSLARGLPVVTTTIGAEGTGAVHGREMLIADEPLQFPEEVVRICRDDALWSRLSTQGRRLAERRFSVDAVSGRMEALLNGSSLPRAGVS